MGYATNKAPAVGPIAIALTLALAGAAGAAAERQMYRCQTGNDVIFSAEPCGPDAHELDLQYDAPSAREEAAAEASIQTEETKADDTAVAAEAQERITAAERKIEALTEERDQRLAELAAQRDRGSGNPADDQTWEIVQGTMDAVEDKYDARIKAVQTEVDELRGR